MRLLWWVFFLLGGLVAAEKAPAQKPAWRTLSTKYFNVYYQPDDSLNALSIGHILVEEYPPVSNELEVILDSPIGVFIAPTKASFIKLTGGHIPHWGEAVADPTKQLMIVKSPRWSRPSENLRIIIIHELVHILVQKRAQNAAVPRWLNEGLAIYFSGETSHFGGKEVSRAQLTEQLIPLETIDHVLTFESLRAHLAYQEAYLAVVHMVEQYGESALPALLQALAETNDIDAAFRKTFGVSIKQFELEWRYYLKKKYKWSVLSEFEGLLWVGLVLLFLLAFVLLLVRNRRTVARWEAEEDMPAGSPPEI